MSLAGVVRSTMPSMTSIMSGSSSGRSSDSSSSRTSRSTTSDNEPSSGSSYSTSVRLHVNRAIAAASTSITVSLETSTVASTNIEENRSPSSSSDSALGANSNRCRPCSSGLMSILGAMSGAKRCVLNTNLNALADERISGKARTRKIRHSQTRSYALRLPGASAVAKTSRGRAPSNRKPLRAKG